MNKEEYAVIIAGGGSSIRYGIRNKLLELLDGVPVFIHSIRNFSGFASRENFILTVNSDAREHFESALEEYGFADKVTVVNGGSSRMESVKNALAAVKLEAGRIVIHDAARPLAPASLLQQLVSDERRNVIAASPVFDSVKRTAPDGLITDEVDRKCLWRAATPQVFDLVQYRDAVAKCDFEATDDASIMRAGGYAVYVVQSDVENIKLTTSGDLKKLELLIKSSR